MWHGSYVSLLEEARIDALAKVGIRYVDISAKGFELPVVSLNIKYKNSIHHGEEVFLSSWLVQKTTIKLVWHTIFSDASGKEFAEAFVDLVVIKSSKNVNKIIRRPPLFLSEALHRLSSGPGNLSIKYKE